MENPAELAGSHLLLKQFGFCFLLSLMCLACLVVFSGFVQPNKMEFLTSHLIIRHAWFYAGNFFVKFSVLALVVIWLYTYRFAGLWDCRPTALQLQKTGLLLASTVIILALGFVLLYFNGLTLFVLTTITVTIIRFFIQAKAGCEF